MKPNFYLVFQKNAYKYERDGGYLWAPKRDAGGRKKSFYDSLKAVQKGDLIFHSHNQKIVAISIAQTTYYEAQKPLGLEKSEHNKWDNDGYKIDTNYFELNTPLGIKGYISSELFKLQPENPYNYPFSGRDNGRGNSGYLYNISFEMSHFLMKEIEKTQSESKDKEWVNKIRNNIGLLDLEEIVVYDEENLNEVIGNNELPKSSIEDYRKEPRTKKTTITNGEGKIKYPRSAKTVINALALANYMCEIDNNHETFLRKKDKTNYTESHHLIPLSKYEEFDYDLDVEENVVSLCSNCHNLLHYGAGYKNILHVLYEKRKILLSDVGLNITFEDLLNYYK